MRTIADWRLPIADWSVAKEANWQLAIIESLGH